MIARLKALFSNGTETSGGRPGEVELQLAAAALLVEAAVQDQDFSAPERKIIHRLLGERFSLSGEEIAALMEEAETAVANRHQLLPYTQAVKNGLEYEDRISLIEMLWEVAYADGVLHDFEAHLLRRIGGLIYISDRDRGEARKRVIARLGIETSS